MYLLIQRFYNQLHLWEKSFVAASFCHITPGHPGFGIVLHDFFVLSRAHNEKKTKRSSKQLVSAFCYWRIHRIQIEIKSSWKRVCETQRQFWQQFASFIIKRQEKWAKKEYKIALKDPLLAKFQTFRAEFWSLLFVHIFCYSYLCTHFFMYLSCFRLHLISLNIYLLSKTTGVHGKCNM